MISEVRAELEEYRGRCEALSEEFRRAVRVRDEARASLAEAEESLKSLQIEGVSLLGDFSDAMSNGNDEKLRELERDYRRHSRELAKAENNRDRASCRLEDVEVEDEEAARRLRDAVSEVLEEYNRRVRQRKQWLASVVEILEGQLEELGQAAAPLVEEYESRQPPEELPPAEETSG